MAATQNLAAGKKRISCLFLKDHDRYNVGESAGFDENVANALKERGLVRFNAHEVRNDTNVMGLLSGQNAGDFGAPQGLSNKIAELIDRKLDEKLQPILALLEKQKDNEPLRGAVKKNA